MYARIALAALVFFVAITSLTWSPIAQAGSKYCRIDSHFHYGYSSGQRSQRAALRAAIRSWEEFAMWEYGSTARYKRSRFRSAKCSPSGGTWSCKVKANPCYLYPMNRRR